MRPLLVLLALALSGCSYVVTEKVWHEAERMCKDSGGVMFVDASTFVPRLLFSDTLYISTDVLCRSGAKFTVVVSHSKDGQ